jgi:hypothetical protein
MMLVSKATTNGLVTGFPVTVSPVGFLRFYLSGITVTFIYSFIHTTLPAMYGSPSVQLLERAYQYQFAGDQF